MICILIEVLPNNYVGSQEHSNDAGVMVKHLGFAGEFYFVVLAPARA